MKKLFLLFVVPILAFFFYTCKKSDNTPPRLINIQGFRLTDYNGNIIGQAGPADSDWTFMSRLSQTEMKLFDFGDTVSLDNTAVTTPNIGVPYPNPVATQQMYYLSSPYPVVAKLVFVDDKLGIYMSKAVRISGTMTLKFDFSNRAPFPNRTSLRVYYSFSAKNNPNFLFGYGDIRICDGTSVSDCF
ncbi:MAG: hypothetical protein J0H74_08120 [Chitinophagaceae bacterium]|nr:hypothetical protein [Chitinophagaceae bacterium]